MEPNQPAKDNPDQQYDFIMNESKKSSKLPKLPLAGLPGPIKLGVGLGVGLVLLIIIVVAYNSFFSTPDNSIQLARVGRQQALILQAAELGVDTARGQAARNLAVTTQLSLIDDQKALLAALGDKNVNVSTRDDPDLEQKFVVAEQANRFDEELLDYLHTELISYARNLQTAYNTTDKLDKDLRAVLAAQYKNARFLAGEDTATETQGQ